MNNNLLNALIEVLKFDERFISNEWDLLKNTIREKAENLDENLISLLLDNETLREKFFKNIKDVIVFNSSDFIKFINNKEFLPDSYTSFKNKIGLTNEKGDFIASSNEVVLSFPFKDCVLAWWQDKDEQKRDEVFYNEILGQDDIDRLFDKKVFTNFKRIDKDWEHKLEWFNRDENGTISDNLIIKWNNLLALHSLKSNFAWKVKLIYIDPPYNTWNDSFNYNDKFNHSTWLTFMKNRLEVARELLRDDWVIFVQCDDNEQAYLKVLMDEIFWIGNFVNNIVWKRKWWNTSPDKTRLENSHDYILMYRKKENFSMNFLYTKIGSDEYIKQMFKYEDENWKYRLSPLNAPKPRPTLVFDFMWYKPHPNWWSMTKEKLQELYDNNRLVFPNKLDWRVNRKQYLSEWNWYSVNSIWTDISLIWASSWEREDFTWWQKPENLIQRVIELWTNPWDIVLDYHLWSGTTCAVAHKMWRQYIWIEQMDYIETISKERMKKVIEWEQWWISKSINWQWWWDFVYMEIMQENERFINEIKKAKNIKDLLEIYNQIKHSEFINYKVDTWILKFDNLEEKDFEDFKLFLIEIIDKNILYKNYSERNDLHSGISEEDKRVNESFYKS